MGKSKTDILKKNLKNDLLAALEKQGFLVSKNKELKLNIESKDEIKKLQLMSKKETLDKHKNFILCTKNLVKKFTINGGELNPFNIKLELREVEKNTLEEKLFRWWNLVWWSMPYQQPYGRQMRFLLWDKTHDAPFGLIALQSPILKQSVRDKALKIPNDNLDYWVNRSMYAQRVGALPPYNELLGGKMVALTLASNEIRQAYKKKYNDYTTIMRGRHIESELLFITTTSAFGKSSLYNRLKYEDDLIAERLGYTQGYGSFQINDSLYKRLIEFLELIGENTGRSYGSGPSKKLKLINLACRKLELPNFTYHGVKREYYSFPYVRNLQEVINIGANPVWKNYTFNDIFMFWKKRWLLKRALNNQKWRVYDANEFIDSIIKSLGGDKNE